MVGLGWIGLRSVCGWTGANRGLPLCESRTVNVPLSHVGAVGHVWFVGNCLRGGRFSFCMCIFFVAMRTSVIHTRMGYGQLPPTPDGHKVMDHPTYNNARPRTNMIRARYDHGTTTFVANALPCTSPQGWHNRGIASLIGPERGKLRTRKRLWHGTVFRLHAGSGAVKSSNEYRSFLF